MKYGVLNHGSAKQNYKQHSNFGFHYFSEKIRLDISCDLSSMKNNLRYFEVLSAAAVTGAYKLL